jgi:predicted transposase YdaD
MSDVLPSTGHSCSCYTLYKVGVDLSYGGKMGYQHQMAGEYKPGHFQFHVIKLWEVPVEVLKQAGLTVLLPLMVLARGGKRRKVVEDAIATIQTVEGEDARELLSLTYVFASLVFAKEADRHWLKRRFRMFEDALKNSWAYQEIMQEGEQIGEQKERQAELQGLRQLLENLVQARFPNNVNLAKERGSAIEEQSILHEVIYKVGIAQTEEDVRKILSN